MRTLKLLPCALLATFMAMPALALECSNSGTANPVAPDDTGDGEATACGYAALAAGPSSLALGRGAISNGDSSTALGFNASSTGTLSVALGWLATSFGANSSALGTNSLSAGISSAALGHTASSSGNNSTALGYAATSSGVASTAMGYTASASGLGSLALGRFASAVADDSIALGRSTSATGERSVALGHLALADQPDTIILGSTPGANFATTYANVGMGTNTPVEAVDVARSDAAARFQLTSFTGDATQAPQFIQRRARGTSAAPTAVQNNDNLGLFSFRGHNGTVMGGSRATITAQAAGTFSASSTPTRLIFATTPVGQTTPQSVLVITPDGKVQVNGVNLNVPDYVFEDDYPLMPLDELKTFIDENGHLPGIAPAHQVKTEGLDLAGSQMNQLQKIEELTLYTLQLQEQLVTQQEHSKAQESRLEEAQQERNAELEALQQRVAHLEAQLNRALATLD